MKSKRLYSGLMALGLACTLIFQTPVLAAEETAETQTSSISTNSISGWPQGPDITSTAAMIMEDSTQTTVYAKNMDQILYPGATVKVMTTLLTLENAQLSDQVTMTATGVSGVTDGGASNNVCMRSCLQLPMMLLFRLQNRSVVPLTDLFR